MNAPVLDIRDLCRNFGALAVARDVAHRVERRITPLATFLVGAAVGRSLAGGAPRGEVLEAALETVASLLPDAPAQVSE